METPLFEKSTSRAERVMQNPGRVQKLIASVIRKSASLKSTAMVPGLLEKIQPLVRMVKSYASKEYREVPWQTIVLSAAALIYFVAPFDAIADFIPILGFADDLAIVSAVLASISQDVDSFTAWEKKKREVAEHAEFTEIDNGQQ
ncbi:YkvA family protein [Pelodictyon luteolum]|uniref:DUF1232 domain-containing protein n=1 Tax=Chlorobium luteolum (strain DSM 273 / BCRC 81028 / 2530) TaxID=319225 RepID=Q3B114_CHLL3|nr:YkvA family protein [Pelodictyon luteolum]ABB24967.1 conserved hypothetical protein [Pelodictyon luteolum DSM 273]